jgi:type IV fimbrial biogenesis protein FimT
MKNRGLTLPELLTTLAIVGILLTALPPLHTQLGKYRLHSSASQLAGSLRLARTQAILSGNSITVLAIGNDWSNGWQVFIDTNRNMQIDASERLLAERHPNADTRVTGNQPVASYVHFAMTGEPVQKSGGFQAGTLRLCTTAITDLQYQIVLGKSGRLRLESNGGEQPCG